MPISGPNRVGPYQLFSLIRSGHACEIWKAQKDNEQPVALKWLPVGPQFNREQINFLRHEYQVGKPMDHEAIIRIYDFGTGRDGAYVAMELFPVLNLKQRINQGVEQTAYLAEPVIRRSAEALAYVHSLGWVHCDVKPDNFLVGDDATVKLIDFSLAQKPKTGLARMFSRKTKVQGTKSYMSPEQIRGKPVDPRSDVYSFGCVVHELIAGRPPFTGVSTNDLLTKHLRTRPPSLAVACKNVEKPFAELIERMMAKGPGDRPDSMEQVLGQLSEIRVFRRRPEPPREVSA